MSSGLLGTGAEDWGGKVKGNARGHVPPVISPSIHAVLARQSHCTRGRHTCTQCNTKRNRRDTCCGLDLLPTAQNNA